MTWRLDLPVVQLCNCAADNTNLIVTYRDFPTAKTEGGGQTLFLIMEAVLPRLLSFMRILRSSRSSEFFRSRYVSELKFWG